MKQAARVHECANLRLLASAVIGQAVRDLSKPDPLKQIDALLWLTGEDFPVWSDMTGAELNPYKLLPRLRQAKNRQGVLHEG